MTAADCPRPAFCPVPDPAQVDPALLSLVELPAGVELQRCYDRRFGPDAYNGSGKGDTRFGPLPGLAHTYVAWRRTVALLETVFHNVHETPRRTIFRSKDLAGRGLAAVRLRRPVRLIDLRDDRLAVLSLRRDQLVATHAEHYPCTRQWAAALADVRVGGVAADGLLWGSRVSELARADSTLLDDLLVGESAQAAVLWHRQGDDGAITAVGPVIDDLVSGAGADLLYRIAEQLDAEIH